MNRYPGPRTEAGTRSSGLEARNRTREIERDYTRNNSNSINNEKKNTK